MYRSLPPEHTYTLSLSISHSPSEICIRIDLILLHYMKSIFLQHPVYIHTNTYTEHAQQKNLYTHKYIIHTNHQFK